MTISAAFRKASMCKTVLRASAVLGEAFKLDGDAELKALEPTFARSGNTKVIK